MDADGTAAIDDTLHAWLCVSADCETKCLLRIFKILAYSMLRSFSDIHVTHTHRYISIYTHTQPNTHPSPIQSSPLLCMVIPIHTHRPTLFSSFSSFIQLSVLTSGSFLMKPITCCFQPHFFFGVSLNLKRSKQYLRCIGSNSMLMSWFLFGL